MAAEKSAGKKDKMGECDKKLPSKELTGDEVNNWRAGLNLVEQYLYMFDHALYTDCTFQVGDEQIGAHLLILGRASPVFEDMFLRHQLDVVVNIFDISFQTFKTVLRYMYSDKLELTVQEDVVEVLLAAHEFQLDSLILLCVDIFKSTVTADNVWQTLTLATVLNEKLLIDTFTQVLRDHTSACTGSESFMECSEDNVVLLVSQDTLSLDGEHALVLLVERWARNQAQERGQAGSDQDVGEILRPRILPLLRLLSLTPAQFTRSVKFAGWLSNNDKDVIVAKNVVNFPDYLCEETQPRKWQNESSWNSGTKIPPNFETVTVCRPVKSGTLESNHKFTKASRCRVYFKVNETFILNGVVLRTKVNPKVEIIFEREPCPIYMDNVLVRVYSVTATDDHVSSFQLVAESSFTGTIVHGTTMTVNFESPELIEKHVLYCITVDMENNGVYRYNSDTAYEFKYKHVQFKFQSCGHNRGRDAASSNEGVLQSLNISI